MSSSTSLVSVHNEWDLLEEVVVGDISYAQHPTQDRGYSVLNAPMIKTGPGEYMHAFPDHVIDETREDLQIFSDNLSRLGVQVRRPKPIDARGLIATPFWKSEHFFCYCPRDILLAIDDLLIETPGVFRSRYFEVHSYSELLLEYFQSGSRWISAPRPQLRDELYDEDAKGGMMLKNHEIVFDAANVLRAGKDLFYLVCDSGNELGGQWLERTLGSEYRVHRVRGVESMIHIDSTICLLRPGLALINPERLSKETLPEALRSWDIIWCPPMAEYEFSKCRPLSSKWLGMNLLMLSPTLAAVDSHQKKLISVLESHGIDCMPVTLRHGRTLGGGVHCVTLDVRRQSVLEDYFS